MDISLLGDIPVQNEILDVYKAYALALLGEYKGETKEDFLCKIVVKSPKNMYSARVLSYMYFVHLLDDENVKKYDKLIRKENKKYLGYSITYQYFIYKAYYDFLKIKDKIEYKDYFKFNYSLSYLEFFKLIPNNEIGNIWMFFSAVKSIAIGKQKSGNRKIKKAIRRIKRQNNIRDYAMFSYLFAIYKQSRKFARAASYNFSEVESAFISYGANGLLQKMALEIEKRSGKYSQESFENPNLDIAKEFEEFIAVGEDFDKSIIRGVYENYKFENIVIFNKTDKGIFDHYSTSLHYRDDIAKKSVKYVFKTGKKLVVTGDKGSKIRNIDSYLMDNPNSRVLILPFINNEKLLYVEDNKDIKYSLEIELENLVHKINKML